MTLLLASIPLMLLVIAAVLALLIVAMSREHAMQIEALGETVAPARTAGDHLLAA